MLFAKQLYPASKSLVQQYTDKSVVEKQDLITMLRKRNSNRNEQPYGSFCPNIVQITYMAAALNLISVSNVPSCEHVK